MRPEYSHSPIDFRFISPAMKFLIIANVAAFVLIQLVGGQFYDLFGLVPIHLWRDRWAWQTVTHLFIHGGFFNLFFNLLILWMFATPIESQWGTTEFLKYYFLCGIGAGIISAAAQPHSAVPIVGASAAIYGLLVAYAMLYPDAVVYLYLLFPIKARYLAVLAALMIFFAGPSALSPGVARFTQLSGMVIGYVYIRWWWEIEIQAKGLWKRRFAGAWGRASRRSVLIESAIRKPAGSAKDDDLDDEVNRILDKISAQGQQSLSSDELDILRRDSERKKSKWGHA